MRFKKEERFNNVYYFSGIYKISKYDSFGMRGKPYYQAYKLAGRNWGSYINKKIQKGGGLTLKQAKQLCIDHAKTYNPSSIELKYANTAMKNWLQV